MVNSKELLHRHRGALLDSAEDGKSVVVYRSCTPPSVTHGDGEGRKHLLILPEVFAVVKVPGRRVAHHFSTWGLNQHGFIPELLGHAI